MLHGDRRRMSIKYRQALGAAASLVRDPFDFPATMRFVDALADFTPMTRLYARMLDGVPPARVEHLRELTLRPLDLEAMRAMPAPTFGRRFAAFVDDHRLSLTAQIDAFPEMAAMLDRDWMMRRFARVHDMHHVLLGFGVDVPAEMGLQIFNLRNFREPYAALAAASLPVSLVKYGEPRRMLAEVARGWTLAGKARNLFVVPFEERLGDDFDALRAELGL